MKLSETRYDDSETGCCARVDRTEWNEKAFEWKDKLFLKDHIREFLHVPLNYGSVISRDLAAIEKAEAYPEHPLWLTDEVSPWGADIYVAVDRDVASAKMTRISGQFMTKVFEGPYRDVGKWIQGMEEYVAASGRTLEKLYFFYATCPRCAKRFGKNEVVLFAQVAGGEALARRP
jgi:hypothetical protein